MKKQYVLVALLALLVACAPAKPMMGETSEQKALEKESMDTGKWTPEQIEQMKKDELMEKKQATTAMSGVLSDGVSKYYDWDKATFDKAVADGKTIVIDFAANWCPVCQQEHPQLVEGFEALNDPNVVGFRVHYKDDQSTPESQALIEQYQIAYQHTKIVIKGGNVVLKSPEAWTKDKFLEEMRKLA